MVAVDFIDFTADVKMNVTTAKRLVRQASRTSRSSSETSSAAISTEPTIHTHPLRNVLRESCDKMDRCPTLHVVFDVGAGTKSHIPFARFSER